MPYYLLSILFYIISKYALKLIDVKEIIKGKNVYEMNVKKNNENIFWLLEIGVFIIMIFYHFVDCNIPPPKQYPWFYPMLNAAFCFCYFFCIFLYNNYTLLTKTFEKDQINQKEKRE